MESELYYEIHVVWDSKDKDRHCFCKISSMWDTVIDNTDKTYSSY